MNKMSTSVTSKNQAKGPVFLSLNPEDKEYGLSFGTFTTDEVVKDGGLIIGNVEKSHNIIDDNKVGFRIVENGEEKTVERMDPKQVTEIIKMLQKLGKDMTMPIKQSEIDLIEKLTGYKVQIKVKSQIIDDVNEER